VIDAPPAIPAEDDLYPGISDLDYHADRTSLSSSGARRLLLTGTPWHFRWEQDHPQPPKPAYDFGHLAHMLVLGEGAKIAVLDPEVHGRKKDGGIADKPTATATWKAAEDEARGRGEVPVHIDEFRRAEAMARVVAEHPTASLLFGDGAAELSGYWHDELTGVRLRYRPDYLKQLPDGRWVCVDYKTAISADPKSFKKSAAQYGYDQQHPWYLTGLSANGYPDAAFLFVVQEKTPPHPVSVIELEPDVVRMGAELNRRAVDIYADCVARDEWPAYGDEVLRVGLPTYAIIEREALLK
jgi:hypothetical protein